MARYSKFLSKRVAVRFRAGDNYLPANGVLVGDSGRSIFLEEHFSRDNGVKSFRWEIPYQCIDQLHESAAVMADGD
jgi:hypothetical protein